MKQGLGILMFCLMAGVSSLGYARINEVCKVLHHRSDHNALEVGKIVLCFTHEPIIETRAGQGKERESLTFFFPQAQLSSAAHTMTRDLVKQMPHYQIDVQQVSNPQGITLSIAYDTRKIAAPEYSSFIGIDLQKGIEIRLYNKELLNHMQQQRKPLLRTACARKPRVVIDCGHGGHDFGAIGYVGHDQHQLNEKDITMGVGLQVAHLLQHEGFRVVLTRNKDKDLSLDERTALANKQGDLFVSIHANFEPSHRATGVETFCLTPQLFTLHPLALGKCDMQLAHTCMQERHQASNLLAHCVQNKVIDHVKKKYVDIVDRKVKHAVSQVLLGSDKPAVLVEVGFVSESSEAVRLSKKDYQHLLAEGISSGIIDWCKTYNRGANAG